MRYSRFSTALALSAAFGEAFALPSLSKRGDDPKDHPICIIGAGPAGLTAAHRLQEQGVHAVVFDKKPVVGGKCQSYYDDVGQYHPLGALLFSKKSYPETMKIIEMTGVQYEDIWPGRADGHRWVYDHRNGKVHESSAPINNKAVQWLLNREIKQYEKVWNQQFKQYAGVGFKKGIPTALTVPTKQWLNDNGFKLLHYAIIVGMSLYGYGAYESVPAAYTLQYFTPDIMEFFGFQHTCGLIDYHEVWRRFQTMLDKQQFVLDARISSIKRPVATAFEGTANPVISYTVGESGRKQKQECAALVLAFPPTLKNLKAAGLDISEEETSVFQDVITENYYSGAVRVQYPEDYTFTHESDSIWPTSPPADGEVVLSIKLWSDNDIATIYSWDDQANPKMKSKQQAYNMVKKSMSIINKKNPGNEDEISKPITDKEILAFEEWDYFPRAMGDALRGGFYKKFHELQGHKRTYYASGLNGFEMVEFAVRAGDDVVNSYMLPWMQKTFPDYAPQARGPQAMSSEKPKSRRPIRVSGSSNSEAEDMSLSDSSDAESEQSTSNSGQRTEDCDRDEAGSCIILK